MTQGKIIIIVDDDTDLLKRLVIAFEEESYEVKTYSRGTEAIRDLVEKNALASADLVILDRLLPDMDGLEILKTIEKTHPSHCPVIFLSMLSSEKDLIQGLKEGAIDYVTKPFNLDLLVLKAKRLINK